MSLGTYAFGRLLLLKSSQHFYNIIENLTMTSFTHNVSGFNNPELFRIEPSKEPDLYSWERPLEVNPSPPSPNRGTRGDSYEGPRSQERHKVQSPTPAPKPVLVLPEAKSSSNVKTHSSKSGSNKKVCKALLPLHLKVRLTQWYHQEELRIQQEGHKSKPYMSVSDVKQMAEEEGVTPKAIQTWLTNRRRRTPKSTKQYLAKNLSEIPLKTAEHLSKLQHETPQVLPGAQGPDEPSQQQNGKKRYFSKKQTDILKHAFDPRDPHLTIKEKEVLVEKTGLTGDEVTTWFKNNRNPKRRRPLVNSLGSAESLLTLEFGSLPGVPLLSNPSPSLVPSASLQLPIIPATQSGTLLNGGKSYVCAWDQCGKIFKSNKGLTLHEIAHTRKKPKIECPHCKSTFKQKQNRNRHIAEKHQGVKKFYCDCCSKKFARNAHYLIHLERVHHFKKPEEPVTPFTPSSFFKDEDEAQI
jgi:hypothetical protein